MTRKWWVSLCLAAAVLACAPAAARAQAAGAEEWAVRVGGDYEVLPNITYATANNTELKLDLYRRRDRRRPAPVVVYIHGGGWVEGRKEDDVLNLLPYLSMGWAVVNVEYRLGRNSLAPAAVEDCRCALRWVHRRAAEHGLDTSKIVLTGFSAGGHLSLITAMLPGGNPFDRRCPTDDQMRWTTGTEPPMKVAAVVNWFGITDLPDLLEGPNAKHYAVEWFGSLERREELARQVSPVNHVRAGLPPVITIHGDRDDLVPYAHATRLHEALDRAGVANQLVTIRGGRHGGFSRQENSNSFAAIRSFLSRHNLSGVE